MLVRVPMIHSLQQAAVTSVGSRPVRRIRVRVDRERPPRGWFGPHGLRGLTKVEARLRGRSGCEVSLESLEPMDAGLLLMAAARVLSPAVCSIGPSVALLPGLPAAAAWLALHARDVVTADDKPNRHLRRSDVVVQPRAGIDEFPDRDRTVVIEPSGRWLVNGVAQEVLVDPSVHRPIGRRSVVGGVVGAARVEMGSAPVLVVDAPGIRLRTSADLGAGDVRALRQLSGLTAPADLPLRWRAQLQAAGVVLAPPGTPFPDDDLGWQVASVRARRRALREYGPHQALTEWPSVSAVMLTHRAEFLDHAIEQLARLDYPNLQVVIALHGFELPFGRLTDLAKRHAVDLVFLPRDLEFGAAMQAASERADGELLTKVDDDDHYAAEHIWDLVLARAYSGAPLVGKALDWIMVQPDDVTVFRPEYAAEQYATFVAGGTMLISQADLRSVGGWRPVPRSIDRALIRRVQMSGGLVYRTHGLGYIYVRRGAGHTASAPSDHFLTSTVARWPGLLRHEVFGTDRTTSAGVAP